MHHGTFILVIGPTGSGKSTLMKHVIALYPELVLPYSYTTRARRADHIENDHYKFLTREEFEQKITEGAFLEWAEYGGNYYGTLKGEVEEALAAGKTLLKEVEVQGARQIREQLPREQLRTVFINAGSWEELEKRVLARAHMDEAQLAERRKRYEDEVTFMPEADCVIDNTTDREAAKQAFAELIQSALQS
ncbi:MAG: guanylate kinase [Bacillota bacterium]